MSTSARFALSWVVFLAALVLVVPPGAALAAPEDVAIGSIEPAQGKPDDWGAPRGRPDDFGNTARYGPESGRDLPRAEDRVSGVSVSIEVAGRPDDWGRNGAAGIAHRLLLDLVRFHVLLGKRLPCLER